MAAAAKRWPDVESRSKLLLRLVEEGRRAIDVERDHEAHDRRATIERTSGALTGVYGPNYLDDLRGEWPD